MTVQVNRFVEIARSSSARRFGRQKGSVNVKQEEEEEEDGTVVIKNEGVTDGVTEVVALPASGSDVEKKKKKKKKGDGDHRGNTPIEEELGEIIERTSIGLVVRSGMMPINQSIRRLVGVRTDLVIMLMRFAFG